MDAAKIILLIGGLVVLCITAVIYAPDIQKLQTAREVQVKTDYQAYTEAAK